MNPREFCTYVEACIEETKENTYDSYDLHMLTAYYSAYFKRVKNFPKLSKYLSKRNKTTTKKQTAQTLFKKVQDIHIALGGK